MSRTPKLKAPAPVEVRRAEVLADFEVTLTTRLFGGGAKARELDEISWLRPPALKGALRFWWRTAHAHLFKSLPELKVREDFLFGAPGCFDTHGNVCGGPGWLSVCVEANGLEAFREARELSPCAFSPSQPQTVTYFPARAQGKTWEPDYKKAADLGMTGRAGVARIRLETRTLDLTARGEVEEALRLWLVLGGVGARTRKGAGAVAITEPKTANDLGLPTSLEALRDFLVSRCEKAPLPPDLAGVFSLRRTIALFVGFRGNQVLSSGEQTQIDLLRTFKAFRQDRKPGTGPRPGTSNWPEPNAIRLLNNPGFRMAPQTDTFGLRPVPASCSRPPHRDALRKRRAICGAAEPLDRSLTGFSRREADLAVRQPRSLASCSNLGAPGATVRARCGGDLWDSADRCATVDQAGRWRTHLHSLPDPVEIGCPWQIGDGIPSRLQTNYLILAEELVCLPSSF